MTMGQVNILCFNFTSKNDGG